jgi:hypothetical protein
MSLPRILIILFLASFGSSQFSSTPNKYILPWVLPFRCRQGYYQLQSTPPTLILSNQLLWYDEKLQYSCLCGLDWFTAVPIDEQLLPFRNSLLP